MYDALLPVVFSLFNYTKILLLLGFWVAIDLKLLKVACTFCMRILAEPSKLPFTFDAYSA